VSTINRINTNGKSLFMKSSHGVFALSDNMLTSVYFGNATNVNNFGLINCLIRFINGIMYKPTLSRIKKMLDYYHIHAVKVYNKTMRKHSQKYPQPILDDCLRSFPKCFKN